MGLVQKGTNSKEPGIPRLYIVVAVGVGVLMAGLILDLDIPLLADFRSFDVVMVMRFMLSFFSGLEIWLPILSGQFFSRPTSSSLRAVHVVTCN